MAKSSELPSELEYVSDWGAQENFRQTFRVHLNRVLILMIQDPGGSFEIALVGIDTLLDYYKDTKYLEDLDEIAYNHQEELQKLKKKGIRGKNISSSEINMRFKYNNARFRALMRLAGRASFLPFPPVAVGVGGKNKDLPFKEEEISSEESEEIAKVIDQNLEEYQELKGQTIEDLKSKEKKEGQKSDR